jgi:hypothetical protein
MKAGDYQAVIFAGTQAGYDAAVAYCGSSGIVVLGPNISGITLGTPPTGVTVWVQGGTDAIRIVSGSLNLREAVVGGNGATDPTLFSEKTLDLSTAISGQAAKSVDIKTRFSNTTAFTNLSLNGMHVINQYGVGGSGGGDVATGLALAGYSEHRGNSAITGSLYGGEFVSTMYNTGSAVNLFGSLNTAQVTSGSTSTVTALRGMQALARVAGSGNGTVSEAVAVEGIAGMQNTAAGTITNAIAGRFGTVKDGGVSGTITNATAIYVTGPTHGGTNNFGVRIASAPSGGSNLNQSLRVDAGDSFFGGKLIVGSSGLGVQQIMSNSATLNFDLTAVVVQDLTITVTGAADGDPVFLGVPNASVSATVQYTAWVSAANTVTVRARTAAVGENPASGTFRATVFHF